MKTKELDDTHLVIQQHEAKIRSMNETIKDFEEKKQYLEQNQDSLNEQLVQLRARTPALESNQQIEQISEQHQKQLSSLREQIRTKEVQIDDFKK